MIRYMLLAAAAVAIPAAASAQTSTSTVTPYSLTNNVYTQNFDTLASTGTSSVLPTGFQISETGTSNAVNGMYTAQGTGATTTGDVYSFGTTADRALGTIRSGTNTPSFGFIFTNNLGSAITSLAFSFVGEEWRESVATDRLDFQYLVGANSIATGTWTDFNALDITTVLNGTAAQLDGNLAANRASYTGTITGLNIAAGQTFGFRFLDADVTSGAQAGLALDDLTIRATTAAAAVPEPASWAMMIVGAGLVGGALRRRGRRDTAVVAA